MAATDSYTIGVRRRSEGAPGTLGTDGVAGGEAVMQNVDGSPVTGAFDRQSAGPAAGEAPWALAGVLIAVERTAAAKATEMQAKVRMWVLRMRR